jgi:hypothetical protein
MKQRPKAFVAIQPQWGWIATHETRSGASKMEHPNFWEQFGHKFLILGAILGEPLPLI